MLHLLIALLALAFSSPTQTWYFGQLTDSKQVIAFTSNGDVHQLNISGDAQFGVRVDETTALFLLTDSSDKAHLYHVTPDYAAEITVPGDPDQLRKALAASASYVVLRQNVILPSQAFLIDLTTDQAIPLTGQLPQLARISEDGKFLRYMSTDGSQWSLIERTLATGQEHVVYTVMSNNPAPEIYADRHGDRWIYADRPQNGVVSFDMISADGAVTPLDSGTQDNQRVWRFLGNDLRSQSLRCDTLCTMEVRSASADMTFTLPADDFYQPLAEPQPDTWLVIDSSSTFWLLRAGDAYTQLGSYDPTRIFMPSAQLISPDGRYLLTKTEDGKFSVLDLTSAKPIVQIRGTSIGQIFYSAQGFTLHSYGDTSGSDQAIAYRYSDGQTISLPNATTSLYFDMLTDGSLLDWNQTQTDGVGAAGIYRYDPATQTYTPIVTNARILVAHPVS